MSIFEIIGILSVLILLPAEIPYYRDVFKGKTKLHRAAMGIFTVLSIISFTAQLNEGASGSLWFAGMMVCIAVSLFLLSFKYGMPGFSLNDKLSLIAAISILILWHFTQSGAIAIILTTSVNFIGKYLIGVKVYNHPNSETLLTWIVSGCSATLAIIAIGELNFILMVPVIHASLSAFTISTIMILRRRNLNSTAT